MDVHGPGPVARKECVGNGVFDETPMYGAALMQGIFLFSRRLYRPHRGSGVGDGVFIVAEQDMGRLGRWFGSGYADGWMWGGGYVG